MNEIVDNFETLLDDPNASVGIEAQEVTQDVNGPAYQENNSQTETETPSEENQVPDYSSNSVYKFLQSKGISDPSKIKVTNEDDTTEEVDFNSLSPDEQLDILNSITDPGLTNDEMGVINFLRQNGLTFQQAIEYYNQQAITNYLKQHPEQAPQKVYEIDDYTDDDLFLIDLKNRYPNLTDEELTAELDSSKENEELFKKKVETIRNNFKANIDQAEAEQAQWEAQQVEDLRNNLMNAAGNFNEIQLDYTDDKSDSLMIDDSDKQQMMSYILDQDSEGKSQLVKDLEDPDRLVEIAWFSTQGAKVLSELTQYWKGLLANERAENKKLQAKLDKLSGSSTVVPQQVQANEKKDTSVWDNSGLL